jgi:hypothetical protein
METDMSVAMPLRHSYTVDNLGLRYVKPEQLFDSAAYRGSISVILITLHCDSGHN